MPPKHFALAGILLFQQRRRKRQITAPPRIDDPFRARHRQQATGVRGTQTTTTSAVPSGLAAGYPPGAGRRATPLDNLDKAPAQTHPVARVLRSNRCGAGCMFTHSDETITQSIDVVCVLRSQHTPSRCDKRSPGFDRGDGPIVVCLDEQVTETDTHLRKPFRDGLRGDTSRVRRVQTRFVRISVLGVRSRHCLLGLNLVKAEIKGHSNRSQVGDTRTGTLLGQWDEDEVRTRSLAV